MDIVLTLCASWVPARIKWVIRADIKLGPAQEKKIKYIWIFYHTKALLKHAVRRGYKKLNLPEFYLSYEYLLPMLTNFSLDYKQIVHR